MLLSDRDILEEWHAGDIVLEPFNPDHLQPASYDVTLDDTLLVPSYQPSAWYCDADYPRAIERGYMYDPGKDTQPVERVRLPYRDQHDTFWLPPGGVALGNTFELVALHPDAALAADIAGCSSLGRWFLFVHVTAGFIDPGWSGRLTLELYNASPWWLRLWAGMRIAQIRFYDVRSMPERSYLETGHYAGAITVQASEYRSAYR